MTRVNTAMQETHEGLVQAATCDQVQLFISQPVVGKFARIDLTFHFASPDAYAGAPLHRSHQDNAGPATTPLFPREQPRN